MDTEAPQTKWEYYLEQERINCGGHPYPEDSHITIYWRRVMREIKAAEANNALS